MKRIDLYLTIIVLLLLELTVFDKIRFYGVRPGLLLVAVLFFGFNFGVLRGVEVGLLAGVLKDLFSVGEFGINILLFLSVGCIAGFLKKKLFKENLITQSILAAVVVWICSLFYFLYLVKISNVSLDFPFWKPGLYKALYTAIIAPFLFLTLKKFFKSDEA